MQNSLEEIARAFDGWAPGYDGKYAGNRVMERLRRKFRRKALAQFPPGGRLLELGCGTGEESLFFAGEGFRVAASDPSPEMLSALRRRVGDYSERVEVLRGSTRTLDRMLPDRAGSFDGAFAYWGPLNYDSSFDGLAENLRRLLKPGGKFVFTSFNPWCFWEIGYYLLKGRPRAAFRRLSGDGVSLSFGEETLRAYCPGIGSLMAAFSPRFALRSVQGLAVFLPPPVLAGALGRPGSRRERAAAWLEERLADDWPFRHWGDQLLVTLEAKP